MTPVEFIVYTYQAGATPLCHAYGPMDEETARHLAQVYSLTAGVTAMAVPLEPTPSVE